MTLPYLTPLPVDALRAAGVPEPWVFGIADRVRFSEIDALDHVNNTAPLRWFESTRVAYMTAYNQPYGDPASPQIVVKSLTADYHRPMYLGEDYIVAARTISVRRTSFVKEYNVFAGDLRYSGTALVVCVSPQTGQKVPMSDSFRQTAIDRDGAQAL